MIKKYIKKIVEKEVAEHFEFGIYKGKAWTKAETERLKEKDNIEKQWKKWRNELILGDVVKFKKEIAKEVFKGLVECAKCGCLLNKFVATKGKSIIKRKPEIKGLSVKMAYTEYVHIPYYCKIHAPKINPKKEQK